MNNSEFKIILQNELAERVKRNSRYSLRSFAKALKIDHTLLSRYIRGEREISNSMEEKMKVALGLPPSTAEVHLEVLSNDVFMQLSDWYHDAILELPRIKNFKPNPRWVAKALGISVNEVNIALDRLIRLGLIEITNEGWIVKAVDTSTILNEEYTSSAAKIYQKQILNKAILAIDEVELIERSQTSLMLSIEKNDLPEIKEMIKEFRKKLIKFTQRKNASHDEVYQLSVSFFPLSQNQKDELS